MYNTNKERNINKIKLNNDSNEYICNNISLFKYNHYYFENFIFNNLKHFDHISKNQLLYIINYIKPIAFLTLKLHQDNKKVDLDTTFKFANKFLLDLNRVMNPSYKRNNYAVQAIGFAEKSYSSNRYDHIHLLLGIDISKIKDESKLEIFNPRTLDERFWSGCRGQPIAQSLDFQIIKQSSNDDNPKRLLKYITKCQKSETDCKTYYQFSDRLSDRIAA